MTEVKSGKASFMAENMILDSILGITAVSQAEGALSKPQKEGLGSAAAILNGVYTGTENVDYYVEIEDTGEIGAATFRWSDNGGTTFNATGVGTSTSFVTLNNGVQIRWGQGAGNDVVDGDNWRFKGYLPYHRNKVLDRERDTEYRTAMGGVEAEALTFDLGTARTPSALVILDHNLSSQASVRLQGSLTAPFTTLANNYAVPLQAGAIMYFLGPPLVEARFWRLQLSDPTNGDAYLRMSEVFLGTHVRLSRAFELGDIRGKQRVGQRERLLSGKFYGAMNTVLRVFDLSWVRLTQTDRDQLVAVFDALNDIVNRQALPVFFSPMDTDLSQIYLCEWSDQQFVANSETDVPERYTVPVRLIEQPRTIDPFSDPNTFLNLRIVPGTGSLTLAGVGSGVLPAVITPGSGALTLAGVAPTVTEP